MNMNATGQDSATGSFAASIFSLLERVEYRRIKTSIEFEDVERLRRVSYEGTDLIDAKNFGTFVDEYDHAKDCYVVGVYVDERLISTVRLHIVTREYLHGPSVALFPEETHEILDAGWRIVDPSRFAADPVALWQYPAIPFLTLRAAAMAAEYFDADYCMSVVREDSASFYRRCFGAVDLSNSRVVQGYGVPLVILAARIQNIREKIATRYPFFKSQPYERKLMFAPQEQLTYPSLNILPSAKYAHMRDFKPSVPTNPVLLSA
jgi:N-acyl-L-homoserine lactone synthetase